MSTWVSEWTAAGLYWLPGTVAGVRFLEPVLLPLLKPLLCHFMVLRP